MKRVVLLYPILLAALPVVFLAAQNSEEVPFQQVLSVLLTVLVATLLLLALLRLFIKDSSKVAVILSVLLVIFFSVGHIINIVDSIPISSDIPIVKFRHVMLFIMVMGAVGSITCAWVILRYGGNLTQPLHYFGIAVSFLLVFNVVDFTLNATQATSGPVTTEVQHLDFSVHPAPLNDQLPDVYYIILDGYAREDILREIHGFDNGEFLDSLRQKGFYVASQSRSNYIYTRFSLASALNMRYINDNERVYELQKDNDVSRIAESLGYKTVQIKYSDAEIGSSGISGALRKALLTDFSRALLGSTMARFVTPLENLFVRQEATKFGLQLRMLREVPETSEPTFSYIHFFPPHPPYIFDQDGHTPEETTYNWGSDQFRWNRYGLYIDQLIYINKKIDMVVNEILESSSVEPIIIIQGDHGTRSKNRQSHLFVSESTGILNAYYLPEGCRSGLYPTITPVNTFRVIFDNCFGTDFDLLEDKSYFFRNNSPPYDFFPVYPDQIQE